MSRIIVLGSKLDLNIYASGINQIFVCPILINYEEIRRMTFDDTDIIILIGILTEKILDNIISIFQFRPNRIIAISAEIDSVDSLKLNIIDYILLRSLSSLKKWKGLHERIDYVPDILLNLRKDLRGSPRKISSEF